MVLPVTAKEEVQEEKEKGAGEKEKTSRGDGSLRFILFFKNRYFKLMNRDVKTDSWI